MKKITFLLFLCLSMAVTSHAQFSENFDAGTTTALPAGWSFINGGSTNTWIAATPTGTTAHSGTRTAVIRTSGSIAHDDYLIAPQITVVAGVSDRFSFWTVSSNANISESFDIKISTSGTALANFNNTAQITVYSSPNYYKRTINLSAYVGQSIYLAIHATSLPSSSGLNIDDIVNDGFPSCGPTAPFTEDFESVASGSTYTVFPGCWFTQNAANQNVLWKAGFTTNVHSGTSAAYLTYDPVTCLNNYLISPKITVAAGVNDRFSFWAKGSTTANRYLKVKVSTTTPNIAGFTTPIVNSIALTNVYKQITLDLSAYVGQSIYLGFHSQDPSSAAFAIDDVVNDAMPQTPDFPQGFENANSIPGRWRTLNSSSTGSWSVFSNAANAHTGTNVAQYDFSSATQNDVLITPPITITAGVNDRLSFWSKSTTNFYSQSLTVGVATVANPTAANFNTLKYCDSFGSWAKQFVDLSAYVGQTIYLSFKGYTGLTSSSVSFYFDDFNTDRLIPALHSNCFGVYNFTTQIPYLLNGQNPNDYAVTFYLNESDANTGTNPLTNVNNLEIYSSSPIYARIVNLTTNAFTTNYFSIISDRISFQFQVSQNRINAAVSGTNSGTTYQWYNQNGPLQGETSPFLNTPLYFNSQYFYLVASGTSPGCTVTSNFITLPIFAEDTFTVNITSETVTTTPSVFANDFLFNLFTASTYNVIPGIAINDDGTISVQSGTPPGTYSVGYFYYGENTVATYQDIRYATVIISSSGIKMNCFLDSNNNGIKDSGEQNFTKGQFHYVLNDNGIVNSIFSSIGSCTIYDTTATNSYDLSYTINSEFAPYYALATPTVNNVVINGNGIQVFNFPITVTQTYVDLSVTLSPLSQPRPGFTFTNRITYTNNGNQAIASGTVTFTPNIGLIISSISQSGTTTTSNGFSYTFSNLNPSESRTIDVSMQVPTLPGVTIGQQLTNNANISNPTGEISSADNSATLIQTVIGSYDPNNKSEIHGGKIVQSSFSAADYLTYTILFENTGTAAAIDVQVTDVLNAKLDETSIRMVASSHDYILNRIGNNLVWSFKGINLPPSVASTQIGHGYIVFKIKPKPGYVIGDIIPNTANIFFDFNPAIVTNTTNTEFVQSLGNAGFGFDRFTCYPNPAHNSITVSNAFAIDEIQIISVLGQKIRTVKVNDLQTQIDVSDLTNGMYFINVKSNGQEKTIKIIKE